MSGNGFGRIYALYLTLWLAAAATAAGILWAVMAAGGTRAAWGMALMGAAVPGAVFEWVWARALRQRLREVGASPVWALPRTVATVACYIAVCAAFAEGTTSLRLLDPEEGSVIVQAALAVGVVAAVASIPGVFMVRYGTPRPSR